MRRYGLSAAHATWQCTRKLGARFLPVESGVRKRQRQGFCSFFEALNEKQAVLNG
jgi:hypothetical protein